MDNSFKYSIDITPTGVDKVSQVPAIISEVSDAVGQVNRSVDPLDKIIKILSNIEKILMAIGRVGVESFNKLDSIAATSKTEVRALGAESEKAKKKIEDIGNVKASNGFMSGFADKIISLQTIAQTIGGLVAPAFQEGMTRQTAAVNFATLLRDDTDTKDTAAQKGKQFADDRRNSTAAALYGTSTINEAAKNMLSFGIDGTKTQTVLSQIGDIAAGDAQKFGSLSLAFAQISSAGKLQGQDLMQLINAGFNPLSEISKKTGKSIGELKDEMAKGAISAEMVEDAFASATAAGGQFHGMLDDIKNNTLQGKMATLQGKLDDLKAKLFELVVPIAEKILPVITDQLIPAIMSVADFLSPVFDLIADNLV
jgi:tape measure domain-containing protein